MLRLYRCVTGKLNFGELLRTSAPQPPPEGVARFLPHLEACGTVSEANGSALAEEAWLESDAKCPVRRRSATGPVSEG